MNIFNFYELFGAAAAAVDVSVVAAVRAAFSLTRSCDHILLFTLLVTHFDIYIYIFLFFAFHTNDRIRLDASLIFDADILFAFKLLLFGVR